MKINNFDVLKRMSTDDKDIRMATLENVVHMRKVKAGTQVTLGVEGDVITGIMNGKFGGCFLLYDWEQFQETKKKIESELR